jgi:DNA-binding GntR family transcriptional regulator
MTSRSKVAVDDLPVGSMVVEGKLAEQLDISRTPIREAIHRLAAEGLLTRQGSRSYVVRQALNVRELIEGEAVELAIGRIAPAVLEELRQKILGLGRLDKQHEAHWEMDDRLHLLFPEALNNGVMVRMIGELRMITRLFELTSPSGCVASDANEHLAILDAFAEGNAPRPCRHGHASA